MLRDSLPIGFTDSQPMWRFCVVALGRIRAASRESLAQDMAMAESVASFSIVPVHNWLRPCRKMAQPSGSVRVPMSMSESAPKRAASNRAATSGTLLDVRRIRMLLGRSPHSKALPADFLDRLARLGRIERYRDGELVHAAWQPVHKLWIVLTGGLRVTRLGEEGSALAVAVLGEGSYYAAGSLVKEGEIVKSEAHAIASTHLAAFKLAHLEREFAGEKGVQQHRMELLYRRFLASADLYRDVLSVPLPQRVARRLLGQALAAGRDPEIELRVSQADLATILGASRSRVNAELRRLEESGAVRLGYRLIVVRSLQLLRAAAGADVAPL